MEGMGIRSHMQQSDANIPLRHHGDPLHIRARLFDEGFRATFLISTVAMLSKLFSDRKVPSTGPHPLSLFELAIWMFIFCGLLDVLVFPKNMLFRFAVSLAAYMATVTFHRLWINPLSNFPGPRFAAATFWYEFYYDVWPGVGQVSASFLPNTC